MSEKQIIFHRGIDSSMIRIENGASTRDEQLGIEREREREGEKEKGRECDSWIVVCGIALKSVVRECERQTAWNETAKKEAARFFSWETGTRQSERAGEAESRDYFGIGQR